MSYFILNYVLMNNYEDGFNDNDDGYAFGSKGLNCL